MNLLLLTSGVFIFKDPRYFHINRLWPLLLQSEANLCFPFQLYIYFFNVAAGDHISGVGRIFTPYENGSQTWADIRIKNKFYSLFGLSRKLAIFIQLTWQFVWDTVYSMAADFHSSEQSKREHPRLSLVFCKLISEVASHHYCHILLIGVNKSNSVTVERITQGRESQDARAYGSHLEAT